MRNRPNSTAHTVSSRAIPRLPTCVRCSRPVPSLPSPFGAPNGDRHLTIPGRGINRLRCIKSAAKDLAV